MKEIRDIRDKSIPGTINAEGKRILCLNYPDGVEYIEAPEGFEEFHERAMNPPVEGTLEYKGFQAIYYHGDPGDSDENRFYGEAVNVRTNIFMEGDTLLELESEFHEIVEEFLSDLVHSSHSIEYYTDDPVILDYYYSHYADRMLKDLERMVVVHRPAVMELVSSPSSLRSEDPPPEA
jgi:hypothetical protein